MAFLNEIRALYLETAATARRLLASDAVASRWDQPSALAEFSVRGLAGHLVRAVTSVVVYLEREVPAGAKPITPAEYYMPAVAEKDIHSELSKAVRTRGEEHAEGGRDALIGRLDEAITYLEKDLDAESPDRLVVVFQEMVLTLDDYLVTRVIELVVHIDDLGVSVGVKPPPIPARAFDLAIHGLVDVARHEHGDVAVIRALARRERDEVEALRVL